MDLLREEAFEGTKWGREKDLFVLRLTQTALNPSFLQPLPQQRGASFSFHSHRRFYLD